LFKTVQPFDDQLGGMFPKTKIIIADEFSNTFSDNNERSTNHVNSCEKR